MAATVFGNPITNTTLEGKAEFAGKKDIQKIDRAAAALKLKNPDGQHLQKLKANLGSDIDAAATFCGVYNATGDAAIFITHHDWAGKNLSPYPKEIANGQWGVFLHGTVKAQVVFPSSVGALVYRVTDLIIGEYRREFDCLLAWSNRDCPGARKTAYTEIKKAGYHFVWDDILKKLEKSGSSSQSEFGGIVSSVKIEDGETPIFEAELKHIPVN